MAKNLLRRELDRFNLLSESLQEKVDFTLGLLCMHDGQVPKQTKTSRQNVYELVCEFGPTHRDHIILELVSSGRSKAG
jgi:hypothetical protein